MTRAHSLLFSLLLLGGIFCLAEAVYTLSPFTELGSLGCSLASVAIGLIMTHTTIAAISAEGDPE